MLWMIRHAAALDRYLYGGPDVERPLDDRGRHQAELLGALPHLASVAALYSSPAVRCTQTLAPLSHTTGVEIIEHPALAEGARIADGVALLRSLVGVDAALCSHGDVIPNLIRELTDDGMTILGSRGCEKASIWELQTVGTDITRGVYHPPPG